MKPNVMIIDDSDFFRTFMTDLCNQMQYNVLDALPNGDAFVSDLEAGKYEDLNLVLLDINLPGSSGRELIEKILTIAPEMIVIMVSTLNSLPIVDECLDLGAANYISKDTSAESMKSILRSTLFMYGFE